MPADQIQVDQTVHGYRDGHELLAASTELSADDRAALLIYTDLAVPRGDDAYAAYLTGYQLPGGQQYALSKTWRGEGRGHRLDNSRGRVFGPGGAAAKLGIPRSTLESKIRTLRIDKHFQARIARRTASRPAKPDICRSSPPVWPR